MKEIIISGTVRNDKGTNDWWMDAKDRDYSADALTGIDYLLDEIGEKILEDKEEVEIIIKLKSR